MHVQRPLLQYDTEVSEARIEEDRLSEFKLKGIVTDEVDVLMQMDTNFDQCQSSQIIPAKLNKTGGLSSTSRAISEQDFDVLRTFSQGKHIAAGNAIWQGDTSIAPFEHGERTGCQFCAYKSLCQFDVTDGKQHYRQLPKLKRSEALQAMKEEMTDEVTE